MNSFLYFNGHTLVGDPPTEEVIGEEGNYTIFYYCRSDEWGGKVADIKTKVYYATSLYSALRQAQEAPSWYILGVLRGDYAR